MTLVAYLRRRGWQKSESLANGAGTFYEAADRGEAVLVLRSTAFADYAVRMAEAIDALAQVEGRMSADVLRDLLDNSETGVATAPESPLATPT